MNIINRFSILFLCLAAAGCAAEIDEGIRDGAEGTTTAEIMTVNILFSEDTAGLLEESEGMQTRSEDLNSALSEAGIISISRLFPDAGVFEPRTRKAGLHRWYKVRYVESPDVKSVEGFGNLPGAEIVEPEREIALNTMFNDPKSGQQWHYLNDGSLSSDFKAGADINVTPVWDNYTTGDRSVIVAVVDAGVDYAHEDLAANYIDGKNFGTGGKITPDDHGTHVAGTIAAVNNNGVGVSGIAGGDAEAGVQGVGILACQIFSGNNPVGGAEAIKWAADHGAVIANNSWGYVFESENDAMNANISADLAAAIDYFIMYAGCDNDGNQLPESPMKGGVVLFSAGNDGWRYNPIGEYEPVIAVGSIGPDYTRAYYSCYGDWVDIAAPGGTAKVNKGMVYSTIVGNKYDFMQGTSMSCPHVSGVAALIASYFGGPGFTNDMLVERLLGGARKDALPASAKIGPLVDALGSFSMGGTAAPDKVEDFDLSAVGNRLDVSIKVTADADDVKTYEYAVLVSEDQSLLQGADMKALPEGVKEYRFKVGLKEVGEYLQIAIPGLEFDKEYHVAVAGYDYLQHSSALSEIKQIRTTANNAPVIRPQQETAGLVIKPYETLTLSFEILDPEGENVEVTLAEKRNGLNLQKGADGTWALTITGRLLKAGEYDCTIHVTDPHGLAADFSFTFEVLDNAVPVQSKEFDDLYVEGTGKTFTYNLYEYFADPEGETLTYRTNGDIGKVADVAISGNQLVINIKGYGPATLEITASDSGKSCTVQLRIMVKDPTDLIELYPVPVKDILNVRTGPAAETKIEIRSASGHIVHQESGSVSAFDPAAIEMKHCAPSRYVVRVTIGDNTVEKIISKI